MRNAKIVCTLGPASDDTDCIDGLVEAGMSVARLNASHGSTDHRATIIDRIRAVDEQRDDCVATILDLPGPEIRTAPIEDDRAIELPDGEDVQFVVGDHVDTEVIGLSTDISDVSIGDKVLIDDGRIETTVSDVSGETVTATVDSGGPLRSRMGVNVPGVDLDLAMITKADRQELELAVEKAVDFVAASFVKNGEDVYAVSETLEELGADVPVIAKIERAAAIENLPSIIEEAYGVMVARGDLGVECPLEQVPLIQKRIIRQCQRAGVPVITATEMLDSMVQERRPTRAEATDVANAVLDGTDALMLSGETAVGDHPVRVVETMDRIIRDIEASEEYDEAREQRVPGADETQTDALARSARFLARDVNATAVVAASESGYTALKAAKYRPDMPVVTTTPDQRVRRRLALSWGVVPRYTPFANEGAGAVIQKAARAAIDAGVAESGDTVVVLSGMLTELEGTNTTNMLKVHVVADTIASGRPIVDGRVSGPVFRAPDGDLTEAPAGAIVAVPADFEGEFTGDLDRIAGIIDGHSGVTGYAAIVARELGIPMISNVTLPGGVPDGETVTLDGERGILYEGPISSRASIS
ncbi:MAG: pyruvate kinase [Halobacteriales archaeon]|nr:pyruvate kinase [Halobacteriales archaeon]